MQRKRRKGMPRLLMVLWVVAVSGMLVGCTQSPAADPPTAQSLSTSAPASPPAPTPAPTSTPTRTPQPTSIPTQTPQPTPIPTETPAFNLTPFVFSQVDDYSTQYQELLAYVNGQRLAHRVMQVNLANHPKISQYANTITSKYGYNACGLVAAAGPSGNWLDVVEWIRQAAGEAYRNDIGIQPIPYTKALRAVFGGNSVQAEDRWTLGEMYQALSKGDIVIVDIQVHEVTEVPSINSPNYSHFARVLGIDLDSERIYIENTLQGQSYWDISLRDFWETWKFPETAVSIKDPGPEAVTRWAVLIRQGAVPHSPLDTSAP